MDDWGAGMNGPNNRAKAILMIAYTYYHSDPRVIREAETAAKAGFDVDFIALSRPGDQAVEDVRGVRLHHVRQSKYRGKGHLRYVLSYLAFMVKCGLKTSRLSLRRRYHLVHVNNMPDFLVFCALVPRIRGAGVLLDIHDPMPNTFASKFKAGERGIFFRLLLWQERASARFADAVVTVHEPVKEGILVKHGLASESIHVIANFPDTDIFAYRHDYEPRAPIRVVFHGTILERAGLGSFVTALSRASLRESIRARIIGEGDFSAELRALIRRFGLSRTVEFDNRSYPVREIPARIADCDVGIVPLIPSSVMDYVLPLKLLEYIAMGLPVISVRNRAIAHYLGDDDCLFYRWDDLDELRQWLDRLAADPRILLRYHRRAFELRQSFSWQAEGEKYVALLDTLCARHAARRPASILPTQFEGLGGRV